MLRTLLANVTVLLALATTALVVPSRAELVDEVMAWVNGEIITKADYDEEEKSLVGDLERQPESAERDAQLAAAREQLLMQMIDRKILVHHAQALGYDTTEMGNVFFEQFKERTMMAQGIPSEAEFDRLMAEQGISKESLRDTLVEMYAPEEVIRFEVTSRLSVSDTAVETYYNENPERFEIPTVVTLREIVVLFDDESEKERKRVQAEALLERIAQGEDFATIAGQFSESGTSEAGGLLGELPLGDLAEHLTKVAAETAVGEVSKVLETPYGFQIVRIESRVEKHLKPLEEMTDRIRAMLEDKKYRRELGEFLEKARAESEWCVKPKYHSLLSTIPPESCNTL